MENGFDWALLFSSVVSIVAIIASVTTAIVQSNNQRKNKAMKMYFDAQLKAYCELLDYIANYQMLNASYCNDNTNGLTSVCCRASLVSSKSTAKIINSFCTIVLDISHNLSDGKENDPNLMSEFAVQSKLLRDRLGEEIMRYDTNQRNQ